MAGRDNGDETKMATVFFNAAQEVAAMPVSGRYPLPEGAVAGTAVVFVPRGRGDALPVPFAVEGADAPTKVTAAKNGTTFTGDLVSVDAESLTLSTDAGVTQTVTDYDDVRIQRQSRPVVVADTSAISPSACVAFVRDGLTWRPSYLVYLSHDRLERQLQREEEGGGAEPLIEQIVAAADIRNRSDRRVKIANAWLAATRVPLPPGSGREPRHAPVAMLAAAPVQETDIPRATASARVAASFASAYEGGDQQALPWSATEAARYDLGALEMDRDSTVTVPLFVTGPPAEQAAVRFCLLPTGPSAPGERMEPLTRGYRFVAEQAMPPGRVTVFDPDMGFLGLTDLGGAVAGEPVDLRLGPSSQVDIDAWVQVRTTHEPVDLYGPVDDVAAADNRFDPSLAVDEDSESRVQRGRSTRRAAVVQVVDRIFVYGTVRNATDRPAVIVLSYRPIVGGTIVQSDPPCDRMTRGVAEWEATFAPGATDLKLALTVDRGQRLVPPSSAALD